MKTFLFILAFLGLSLTHIFSQTAVEYYNRGISKDSVKDFKGAISDYSKAIEIDPLYVEAFLHRGLAKKELQDYQGAIKDYNKAIKIDSKNGEAYFQRGLIKDKLQDFFGAIEDFDKAIKINPNFSEAYFNRGITKITIGYKESACSDWSKAGELGYSQAYNLIQSNCTTSPAKKTYKESTAPEKTLIEYDEIIFTYYYSTLCNIKNANGNEFHVSTFENPDFTIKTSDIISVYNFNDYKSNNNVKNLKTNYLFASQIYQAGRNINSATSCFIWGTIIVGLTSFIALESNSNEILVIGLGVGLIVEIAGIANIYSAGHRLKSAGRIAIKL